jgi:hypothetical protein
MAAPAGHRDADERQQGSRRLREGEERRRG